MKDIITILTENIGQKIADKVNNNIIDELLYEGADEVDFKQFLKDLKKEDIELFKKVQEYTKKSKLLKNNRKTDSSSSSSSSSYDYSCGSGRRSSSCGSSASYGGGCGYGSRNSRSGGC